MAEPANDSSSKSIQATTLTGLGSLVKLLPTGTVFVFQFLNPVLTNSGHCAPGHKYASGILIALCGLSCWFSSFTDSYVDGKGVTRHGVVTTKGLWPSSTTEDLSSYKLQFADFVHASLSLTVFAVLSLLNSNTVKCFYPSFESNERTLLASLPPVIGAISGTVFMLFPNNRHGIGYRTVPES